MDTTFRRFSCNRWNIEPCEFERKLFPIITVNVDSRYTAFMNCTVQQQYTIGQILCPNLEDILNYMQFETDLQLMSKTYLNKEK